MGGRTGFRGRVGRDCSGGPLPLPGKERPFLESLQTTMPKVYIFRRETLRHAGLPRERLVLVSRAPTRRGSSPLHPRRDEWH